MIDDPYLISVSLIYVCIGALARALFGLVKTWNSTVDINHFGFNWKRVLMEIVSSILLGIIGILIISESPWSAPSFSMKGLALLGGLFGPDTLKFITKKLGITNAFDIRFTDQQVMLAEFNPRQIAALEYMKKNRIMTSSIYQEINQTSSMTSKRDLATLVKKGKVKKCGKSTATCYKII
jgi:hypothetical protein